MARSMSPALLLLLSFLGTVALSPACVAETTFAEQPVPEATGTMPRPAKAAADHLPGPAVIAAAARQPLAPVPALDLARYMGRWHEIARFPNWFQKKCVAAATADYSLQPDGTVRVVNRCRTADGTVSVAEAEGRRTGPAGSAKLEVRFAPAWLSFLPFVWGKYWVVDIDPQYRLVAVGEPGRDYLWILARTPAVARADYEALRARLALQGFDAGRLQVTGTIE